MTEVQLELSRALGIEIPQAALRSIAKRGGRTGHLRSLNGTIRLANGVAASSLAADQRSFTRRLEELHARFLTFAESHASESQAISIDEFVTSIERRAPFVIGAHRGVRPTTVPDGAALTDALVCQFILELDQNDDAGIKLLAEVVGGAMVAAGLFVGSACWSTRRCWRTCWGSTAQKLQWPCQRCCLWQLGLAPRSRCWIARWTSSRASSTELHEPIRSLRLGPQA
jgi:hypothetical protein